MFCNNYYFMPTKLSYSGRLFREKKIKKIRIKAINGPTEICNFFSPFKGFCIGGYDMICCMKLAH